MKFFIVQSSAMYVRARGARFVAVQLPRAVYWKIPFLPPVASQPEIDPSPAPMSACDNRDAQVGEPGGPARPLEMEGGKYLQAVLQQAYGARVVNHEQHVDLPRRHERPARAGPSAAATSAAGAALASAGSGRPPQPAATATDTTRTNGVARMPGPRNDQGTWFSAVAVRSSARTPVVRAGRQHETVVAEAVDEVRDPDRRIGDVAVGRGARVPRCLATVLCPSTMDSFQWLGYGVGRARNRGDDDLLIRERLRGARSWLDTRRDGRQHAGALGRDASVQGHSSRSRLRSAPGAVAWRHCRGGRTRCSGNSAGGPNWDATVTLVAGVENEAPAGAEQSSSLVNKTIDQAARRIAGSPGSRPAAGCHRRPARAGSTPTGARSRSRFHPGPRCTRTRRGSGPV